jgi:hypothetical protein
MSWTAIIKNTAVEDDPVLTVIPYFGDDDREGVDLSLYQMDATREEEHDPVHHLPLPPPPYSWSSTSEFPQPIPTYPHVS